MPSISKSKRPKYREPKQQRGSAPLHPCYNDARYRRLRDRYKVSQDLTCEVCGTVTERLDCDHAIRLVDGGHWHDSENFLALCKDCHGIKNGMERTGYAPEHTGEFGFRVPVNKQKIVVDILERMLYG